MPGLRECGSRSPLVALTAAVADGSASVGGGARQMRGARLNVRFDVLPTRGQGQSRSRADRAPWCLGATGARPRGGRPRETADLAGR